MSIRGSCHCGKIAYTLAEEMPTEAMECNCSICRRKGSLHHFTTPDKFTLEGARDDLTVYTFNSHSIRHQFCKTCGCAPFAEGTGPDGKAMVEINLRCLEGLDLARIAIKQFDGASLYEASRPAGGNRMTVKLNHTIVLSRDPHAAAIFMSEILGLPEPVPFGPFLVVKTGNEVSLDFLSADGEPAMQHYAFLVSEAEFDEIFGRIRARNLDYWADPGQQQRGEINTRDGGRGCYFEDPSGHLLEILTRQYGSG